ncbi:SPASM domain-containing protein [Petrachloros mirabilis]
MRLTQYLIMEICRECNLGKLHPECPNLHRDRYASIRHDEPVPDKDFLKIATAMYREYGFRGRVGFHYYNEPLVASARMWRLMDQISGKVPEAEFVLWSNGVLLPEDCREFKRFAEIHITDYRIPKHEAKNLGRLLEAAPWTQVHHWPLDDRLFGIGEEASFRPCHRMFTEFIIDYFGNVHLCCYDWQGLGTIGNVQERPLAELVADWQKVRQQIGGNAMDPRSPLVCLKCTMKSGGFPQNWIGKPEIGAAARQEVKGWEM